MSHPEEVDVHSEGARQLDGRKPLKKVASPRRAALVRLLSFILLPAFGALAPLLALPAVTARYGAHGWAAVAIGQSLGSAFAVVVELGWRLNGTQRVARQKPHNRAQTLALAMTTKITVLIPIGAAVGVAAALISPSNKGIAATIAIAGAVSSLDLVWFFIGTARPMLILVTDTVPRDGPVVLGAVMIAFGAPLWVFPLALTTGAVAAPAIGLWVAGVRPSSFRRITIRRTFRAIRIQSSAFTGTALSAVYIALPVTLVGLANPAAVTVFAAADRLQRMLLSGLQAVPNSMQGWVGAATSKTDRLRRAWRALFANASVGVLVGATFILLAPFASQLVFSGVAPVMRPLALVGAVIIFVVCCSRATGGLILVALRGIPSIRTSALVGCIVGIPAILVLSWAFGPIGGLAGEACAEISVLCVQLAAIVRLTSRERLRVRDENTRVVYFGTLASPEFTKAIVCSIDPSVECVVTTPLPKTLDGARVTRLVQDLLRVVVDSHGHDVYVLSQALSGLAPAAWIVARMNHAPLVLDCSARSPQRGRRNAGRIRRRIAVVLADAVYDFPDSEVVSQGTTSSAVTEIKLRAVPETGHPALLLYRSRHAINLRKPQNPN